MPLATAEICGLGGDLKIDGAHGEWVDGKSHETAFTTTFSPNEKTVCPSLSNSDLDWISQSEGRSATVPTFAAFTARSYHSAGVTTSCMDGSVHTISNRIDRTVWQALSTRDGDETASLP
jgi:hypothetical protein